MIIRAHEVRATSGTWQGSIEVAERKCIRKREVHMAGKEGRASTLTAEAAAKLHRIVSWLVTRQDTYDIPNRRKTL